MKILRSIEMDGSATDRGLAKQRNSSMKTTSSLYRLDPFLDSHDVQHLGGRIKHADVPYDLKHPVILPKKSHIPELIIRHYHHQVDEELLLTVYDRVGTGSLEAPLLLETSSQNVLSAGSFVGQCQNRKWQRTDWNHLPLSRIVRWTTSALG